MNIRNIVAEKQKGIWGGVDGQIAHHLKRSLQNSTYVARPLAATEPHHVVMQVSRTGHSIDTIWVHSPT